MTVEEKITRLLATQRQLQDLRQLESAFHTVERNLAFSEREADQVFKAEEAAVANLGYRRKAFAEAREAVARMERNPGVSFLGLKSPSRLKLEAMRQATLNYARASDLAFAREALARKAGARTRARLAELAVRRSKLHRQVAERCNSQSLANTLGTAERNFETAKRAVSESEIDGAVMTNRIDLREAARARTMLRQSGDLGFER